MCVLGASQSDLHLSAPSLNACEAEGSYPDKKICSYLDIVEIALTPPPCFLGHLQGTILVKILLTTILLQRAQNCNTTWIFNKK